MRRTKIKICGITNEEDAFKLSQMAVDALGFIVIISARRRPFKITLKKASKIIAKLPPFITSVVGVHRKYNSLEEVINILRETSPDAVQLQFGGTLGEIKKIKQAFPTIKIIKTFFVGGSDLKEIKRFSEIIDMILIHGERGEEITSKEEYLKTAREVVKNSLKPVMIAGGLDLSNVALVIEKVRPYAVDLISGVETVPGKKDFVKVDKLIKMVGKVDKKVYRVS